MVDGAGKTQAVSEVKRIYDGVDNLHVLPGGSWNIERLHQLSSLDESLMYFCMTWTKDIMTCEENQLL